MTGALALGAALPSAALAADTGDSIGVRLVEVPSGAIGDPRARLYIVDHVAPGTRIERRIEVTATSAEPTPVSLYAGAASVAAGTFTAADAASPNEVSTWTSVDPASLTLPAGGSAMATVTIDVPSDASPGERYGAVWVEARSPAGTVSGVTTVNRVGIRIYLSVGPGGPPAADFEIDSLTAERSDEGQPIVVASVRNTGGRALDLSGSLTMADGPGSLSAGPFPAQLGVTLGIGETEPVEVRLDAQLPDGPWDAQLTLASGLVERSVRGTLTFPDAGSGPTVAAQPLTSRWRLPALVVLAGLLVAGAVMVVWVIRRRRRQA